MEEQWIREIQRSGSRAAAEALIRARYDEIYRFVYRQTGHKEEDVYKRQSQKCGNQNGGYFGAVILKRPLLNRKSGDGDRPGQHLSVAGEIEGDRAIGQLSLIHI